MPPAHWQAGALAALLATLASFAPGQPMLPPLARPSANPDPLRMASLPFDLAPVLEVEKGQWRWAASLGYANLWNHTWHTVAYHREVGRVGQPLSSAELAALAKRYPNDWYQFLDVELMRAEVWVQRGFGRGVTATVHVPYYAVGRPHWDGIAETWHKWLGLPDFNRQEFPRGQTLVYIKGPGGEVERRDLARSGWGDISLAVGVPVGRWLGAWHRAVAAVEAPTGKRGTLHGSGGWDAGARFISQWRGERFAAVSGLGYTWPAPRGSLLGLRRNRVWHTMVGLEARLWRQLVGGLRLQVERALLAETAGDRLAKVTLVKRFGVAVPLGRETWLAFDLGQDSIRNGISPDYSFHLTVGSGQRP